MSVTGFWVDRSSPGVEDLIVQIRGVSGTQYTQGDACLVSTSTAGTTGGLVIQAAAQTDAPEYVFLSMVTDPTQIRPATFNKVDSAYEFLELIECIDSNIVLNNQFAAATFDGTACNSNATATSVLFTGAGSNDDFTGGQVYIPELGQQRTVIDDAVSGGVHTLTVAPAFSRAPTTGDTLRVVPWGPGYRGGVKLQTPNPQQGISVAVADKTGGHLFVYGVNLNLRVAYVRFSGVSANP